jgi:hypothetical protein
LKCSLQPHSVPRLLKETLILLTFDLHGTDGYQPLAGNKSLGLACDISSEAHNTINTSF